MYMITKIKVLGLARVLALTFGVGLAACSGSTTVATTLVKVLVTPATATLAPGGTQQLTATGAYSDGTTQDLSGTVTWSSSAAASATVSTSGLATAVSPGSATITATSAAITGTASLVVTAASLTSISVTPSTSAIGSGGSEQFTATGNYSDGSAHDLTATATWTSATVTVATISTSGLATAVGAGSSVITATSGSKTATATLTVSAATVSKLVVSPATTTLSPGQSAQLTVIGAYSDGSTQDLTAGATWTTSAGSVATVSASGLVLAVAAGSASFTATAGGRTATASTTVSAATVTQIVISPATTALYPGQGAQLAAIASYSDGSTQDLTASATWKSSAVAVATVSASGLAHAVATGTATFTATAGGKSATASITVSAATLTAIDVAPGTATVAAGGAEQLSAIGFYSDGSWQDLTTSATWTSSALAVATVSSSGAASALSAGGTTITATVGSVHGASTLTVSAASLVALSIAPSGATLAIGANKQLTATGTFSDGSTHDLTSAVTWSPSTGGIATVSNTEGAIGLATAVGAGVVTVIATEGAISASTSLYVSATPPVTVTALTVTPAASSLVLGNSLQLAAKATYSDGTSATVTSSVIWSSSNAKVVSLSNTAGTIGLATSVGTGSTTIVATNGTFSGTTPLTVTPATLQSLAVSPSGPSVSLGNKVQFVATGSYSDLTTQTLTTQVTWSSSNAGQATVTSVGLASTLATGSPSIIATLGGVSNSTTLSITAAVLASLAITPANSAVALGATSPLTATGTFTDGTPHDETSLVTWTSSNPATATITSAGVAKGIAQGAVTASAALNGITANTTLTVGPAALTLIVVTPANISIPLGTTQQYVAKGSYTDGTSATLASPTWSSNHTNVATVASSGVATPVGVGSTTIAAAVGTVSGGTLLTIVQGTLVTGIISANTTWTAANSPYIISGTVQIAAAAVLTIQPGVVVEYASDGTIQLAGSLVAQGTAVSGITFMNEPGVTSTGGPALNYIKGDLSASSFGYVTFQTSSIAITVAPATTNTLQIANATITSEIDLQANTQSQGITIAASTITGARLYVGYPYSGKMMINNSTLTNDNIYADNYASGGIVIQNSSITGGSVTMNCCTSAVSILGLVANTGGPSVRATVKNLNFIDGNSASGPLTISNADFTDVGIGLSNVTATITNSTFTADSAFTPATMLTLGSGTMTNATVTGNGKENGMALSGHTYGGGTFTISQSIITGHAVGIVATSGGGGFAMSNTSLLANTQYALQWNLGSNVTLSNNWWGTTTPATISAAIYDGNDNINDGIVTYSPVLTAASPTAGAH